MRSDAKLRANKEKFRCRKQRSKRLCPRVESIRRAPIRRRTRAAAPPRHAATVVSTWSLLVVDTKRIRQKVQRDYQRAARDLNTAREQSERYHSKDKPLFSQWLNKNFGAQLTEMRELQTELFEAQRLVNEVQQEYFYGGHPSIAAAYKRVLQRRAHPEAEAEEQRQAEQEIPPNDAGDSEEKNSADDFWERFEELNSPGKHSKPQHDSESRARLKDLYRKLARRLHPDNGQQITPRDKELWHQTQDAYDNGQVEVLETILAQLEINDAGAKNAAISTLLQLTAGLKQRLRSLRRELSNLRRDMAWGFSQRTDFSDLVHETEHSFHSDRTKLLWLLTKYRAQIERWELQARPHRENGKRVRSRRTNWMDEEWF